MFKVKRCSENRFVFPLTFSPSSERLESIPMSHSAQGPFVVPGSRGCNPMDAKLCEV